MGNKICVLVGTRPGIVKMSPIIRSLKEVGADYFVIHSGQHYSLNMDAIFFDDIGLDRPQYRVETRAESLPGEMTADMIKGIEQTLLEEKPGMILVCGDANTNLAGALAARKLHIQIGHVESGLRSYDWSMPEEHNRIMIDHISEYLFAPTELAKKNLIEDKVQGKIFVVGNTVVDAVNENLKLAVEKSTILEELSLSKQLFVLATCHREENVDSKQRLDDILESLRIVSRNLGFEVILPLHPRTQKRLKEFGIEPSGIRIVDPVGYLDFLILESNARLILTDSGGIQEEACILQVPCVTLRDNTERPETIEAGWNILGGVQPQNVVAAVEQIMGGQRVTGVSPFGEGGTARNIVQICLEGLST